MKFVCENCGKKFDQLEECKNHENSCLTNNKQTYNETFETLKKYCEEHEFEFEKDPFDYFIKNEKYPHKQLNDKIVMEVVKFINEHIRYESTYATEMGEKITIDELCKRFKIDELEMCGILIDIEEKFNICLCLCLNDIIKLKYFREIEKMFIKLKKMIKNE